MFDVPTFEPLSSRNQIEMPCALNIHLALDEIPP